jgi:hypothetical protein
MGHKKEKVMLKSYRNLFCLCIIYSMAYAVINQFEDSYARTNDIHSEFEAITMSEVDVESLLREDDENKLSGAQIPLRYAHAFDVEINSDIHGTWEEIDGGGMLWRVSIHSPRAYGIKAYFNSFWLPKGGKLYAYSKDDDMSIGPYTHEQNHEDNSFAFPLVKSDHIVIEYYHPSRNVIPPQLAINKVFHAYRDIHNFYEEQEDLNRCYNNVACPEADPYEDQINSVIYLDMGGYICSAVLVNNTSQDQTPYVLTAWHCVEPETPGEHNYFTFYFNHQSSSCSGSGGSYSYSETGSYLRSSANLNNSDFALLEMDDDPPSWWNPYFAGWSRSTASPAISVGIHHPGGAGKKINYDNDTAYSCSWYSGNDHWCLAWDNGGTAGGSSGSPLFNTDKRIVGQLSGGTGADCTGTDLYGKLSSSWNGSNSSSRLQDWLDPGNTNVYTLDGTYDGEVVVYGCTNSSACNYESEATDDDGSCYYAEGTCDCNGDPEDFYCDCNGNVDDACGECGGNGTSCNPTIDLSIGTIDVANGTIDIDMSSEGPVSGFQFILSDAPDYITITGAGAGAAGSYGFTTSTSLTGIILGFSLAGAQIPAGDHTLVEIYFDIDDPGTTTALCLEDVVISDPTGTALGVNIEGCEDVDLLAIILGDINFDGAINILDVVVQVDAILSGSGENLSSSEFIAADFNGDGILNVIDVVLLVNAILGL